MSRCVCGINYSREEEVVIKRLSIIINERREAGGKAHEGEARLPVFGRGGGGGKIAEKFNGQGVDSREGGYTSWGELRGVP